MDKNFHWEQTALSSGLMGAEKTQTLHSGIELIRLAQQRHRFPVKVSPCVAMAEDGCGCGRKLVLCGIVETHPICGNDFCVLI